MGNADPCHGAEGARAGVAAHALPGVATAYLDALTAVIEGQRARMAGAPRGGPPRG